MSLHYLPLKISNNPLIVPFSSSLITCMATFISIYTCMLTTRGSFGDGASDLRLQARCRHWSRTRSLILLGHGVWSSLLLLSATYLANHYAENASCYFHALPLSRFIVSWHSRARATCATFTILTNTQEPISCRACSRTRVAPGCLSLWLSKSASPQK